MLSLGIDTGGTYTDAVLFDPDRGVVASAKALTTRHDLGIGIAEAIASVLGGRGEAAGTQIGLVSISTTLATNALVEGRHAPVCLILIGQGAEALERAGLGRALGDDPVVFVSGGHDAGGLEQQPLDTDAIREAVRCQAGRVEAFAIAGYFAVRNAGHERAARAIVHEACDLPVTCSHELSAGLDAPRRAMTAVLNARLVPLIRQLIDAVRATLAGHGIDAPLMLVRGDGSLLAAEEVRLRPVETILSGPAASVVGARYLCGLDDAVVSDIGGTTTDIALLVGGLPRISPRGATVGGWRTMVEAVAVHTFGLGGDSEVQDDGRGGLAVGPRRVVPLSLLARDYPGCVDRLRMQLERVPAEYAGRFALRGHTPATAAGLSRVERQLLDGLVGGPRALSGWIDSRVAERALLRLARRELVWLSGFTPSDAAHVLGIQRTWSVEAARLGAGLWAQTVAIGDGQAEPFARAVIEALVEASARAITVAALAGESPGGSAGGGEGPDPARLEPLLRSQPIARAFGGADDHDRLIDVQVRLCRPLVGIGAPAPLYYDAIADRLGARLEVPERAGVCNAVGAVAGSVIQRARIVITAPEEGRYRVHLAEGVEDFGSLEDAAGRAAAAGAARVRAAALAGGAAAPVVQSRREDTIVEGAGGLRVFVETVVEVTASGRPAFGGGGQNCAPSGISAGS